MKNSLSFTQANDGVFYMTVEDYHAGFEETNINFDLSDGDWFEERYLFLNDEDRKNGTEVNSDRTRHEFFIKNTSNEVQKVYA